VPVSDIATEDEMMAVRFQVRDFTAPYKFEPIAYCLAFEFALQKLTYDFKVTSPGYIRTTDVPYERKFLALKLTTIQMCQVRASAAADLGTTADDVAGDGGDITMVTVPGLQIQEGAEKTGAAHWLDLAERLQDEYDDEIGVGDSPPPTDTLPEVQQSQMFTTTLRNGARRPYALDSALAAPVSFAGMVSGSDVVLTWDAVKDMHFAWYEIYRVTDPDTLDTDSVTLTERIKIINNPHGVSGSTIPRTRYTDEAPGSGTHYYAIASVNDNMLRGFSGVITVVVP